MYPLVYPSNTQENLDTRTDRAQPFHALLPTCYILLYPFVYIANPLLYISKRGQPEG